MFVNIEEEEEEEEEEEISDHISISVNLSWHLGVYKAYFILFRSILIDSLAIYGFVSIHIHSNKNTNRIKYIFIIPKLSIFASVWCFLARNSQ